ncbi:MAG: hypothetical protein ACTSYD_02565 [Candidatus Heimdallarchaeaceae archaeon]
MGELIDKKKLLEWLDKQIKNTNWWIDRDIELMASFPKDERYIYLVTGAERIVEHFYKLQSYNLIKIKIEKGVFDAKRKSL